MKKALPLILLVFSILAHNSLLGQIADAGPDVVIQCNLLVATLGTDSTSMGPEFTYAWASSGGNMLGDEPFLEVTNAGTYILTVTDTIANNMASDTVKVFVAFEFIGLSIFAPGELNCMNNQMSLEVNSEIFYFSETSILWQTTTGNIISDPTLRTIDVDEPGLYEVVVTNLESGCTGSSSIEVTLDEDTPDAILGFGELLTCSNTSVLINGSGSSVGQDITYEWFDQDGLSLGTDINLEVTDCGVYTLVVTNIISGCFSSAIAEVYCDHELPIAIIEASPLISEGGTVQLNAQGSSAGPLFEYLWSTQDGSIVSGENSLEPIVDQAGTYCLSVVNAANDCEIISCVTVDQAESNTLIADAGPDIILDCTTGQINTTVGGPNTTIGDNICYTWVNETTQQTISDSLTAVITEVGFYTLTVLDKTTNEMAKDTVHFIENLLEPFVNVDVPEVLTCNTTVVEISASSDSDTHVFSWTTIGGNIISDPNAQNIMVDAPGIYDLEVTDPENGCASSTSVIVVEDVETGVVTNTGLIYCGITEILLDPVTMNGNFSYAWLPQEGLEIIDSLAVRITLSGTYTLVQTNLDTGCEILNLFPIEIADPIEIDLGPDLVVDCNELPIVIDPENFPMGGNFEYAWMDISGIFISNEGQVTIESPGTYTLSVTDLNTGCLSTDEISITQSSPPMSIVSSITDITCPGGSDGSVTITVTGGTPPFTYNGTNLPNQENLPAGNYTIDVIDALGCSETITFVITEPEEIPLQFEITDDGDLEVIAAGGLPPYTYDWNVDADSSVIVDPINGTEYTVTVTDANGCEQTASFLFETNSVFVPNAIALSVFPNPTDGLLKIQMGEEQVQSISQIQIFDIRGIPMRFDKGAVSSDGIELDLSAFQLGAYILNVVIEDKIHYQKLIVH